MRLQAREHGKPGRQTQAADLSVLKKLLMSGAVQQSIAGEMAGLDTAKRVIESS